MLFRSRWADVGRASGRWLVGCLRALLLPALSEGTACHRPGQVRVVERRVAEKPWLQGTRAAAVGLLRLLGAVLSAWQRVHNFPSLRSTAWVFQRCFWGPGMARIEASLAQPDVPPAVVFHRAAQPALRLWPHGEACVWGTLDPRGARAWPLPHPGPQP